jgi:hypothetical protein
MIDYKNIIFAIVIAYIPVELSGLRDWFFNWIIRLWRKRKIYNWIKENTQNKAGEQFKSTTEISKGLDIDEDRVRKICSRHKKIFECSGEKDLWSIYGSEPRSVYEEQGIISV